MAYSKERIKFSNQTVYLYCYIVGWGKTGPAHSFLPSKCFDLSIYHLVFCFMLVFYYILILMNDLFQRENEVFKPNSLFVLLHCGWGKTGPAHSFPTPQCFDLFIYLSVFWIMLLFDCIWTLMNELFQREDEVSKPNSLLVLLHYRVGKDPASTFFPPLQNVLIFLFIFQSFGLCYSFTVSEDLWMTCPKR